MSSDDVPSEYPHTPMTMDEIDELVLSGKEHAKDLNNPRSKEFVINNRGQRLHLSSHWPEGKARAFVLFIHGYASHSNRPTHRFVEKHFAQYGIGYITMDLHTHGYSEGAMRCLVLNKDDLLDDVLAVLLAVTGDTATSPTHHVNSTASNTPYFIFGHSMGGGVALCVANILTNAMTAVGTTPFAWEHIQAVTQRLTPCFRGCILLSPLTWLYQSPVWLCDLLAPVAMMFPSWEMPTHYFRTDESVFRNNWTSEKYIKYAKSDTKAESSGLTFWGGIRVGTGVSMYDLCLLVQASNEQATFPMLFIHDPKDVTCNIAGSRQFVARAPSKAKRLIEISDSLHDPLANRMDVVCHYMSDWVLHHLKLAEAEEEDCSSQL